MTSLLETKDGRFIAGGEQELDGLFERLAKSSAPRLLLHVHGGLVDDGSARADAQRLDGADAYGPLLEDGWQTGYLIWRTGFFQTVATALISLNSDALFTALKAVVRRWLVRKAGDLLGVQDALVDPGATAARIEDAYLEARFVDPGEIRARLSPAELALVEGQRDPAPGDELYDELARDPALQAMARSAGDALTRREASLVALQTADELILASLEKLDEPVGAQLTEAYAAKDTLAAPDVMMPVLVRAARAGYRAVRRALAGRDHGIQATVVEEISRELYADLIGSRVWGQMKGYADHHFAVGGAGTLLLDKLKALAEATDGPVRLLFVGHSAGSIVACDLVAAAASLPRNVVIDFVFLAPAVRLDKAAKALAAAEARLDNIRIFTMCDEREIRDPLDGRVPLNLYPRSLLYLISGILENDAGGDAYPDAPLLGLERHLRGLADSRLTQSERQDRDRIRTFLAAAPSRVVFSPSSAGAGLDTDARSHGTIDNDPGTLASIRHVARSGY